MANTEKIQGTEGNTMGGSTSGQNTTGTTTMGDVAGRGWQESDQGTSSPSSVAPGTSNYSGTNYNDQGASPSTFTRENLSSIAGGKGREEMPNEGWTEGTPRAADKVQDIAGQVRDQAGELANEIAERAQDFASRAQDIASDVAQRAQDAAGDAIENLSDTVRRYPVQSLLVGFGLGALIGMLIPSRR